MGSYSLRLLDIRDNVTEVFQPEYGDLLDALDAAKELSTRGTIEVWGTFGRIARVKKDNRPSLPQDRVSG